MQTASPIHHKGKKTGILLVHGFSSTPVVFTNLAKKLEAENYSFIAPTMAGHGTSPDELAKTSPDDWIASVIEPLEELRKHCDKVFVLGVSMGGNVACALASRKKIDGLILLATPRWLQRHYLVYTVTQIFRLFGIKYYHKPFRKTLPDGLLIGGPTFSYASLRIKSVRDVFFLITKMTPRCLKNIDAPTLVIHSDNDGLVRTNSGEFLFQNIRAEDKQLIWIHQPHHLLHMEENTYEYILDFIRRLEKNSP